MRALTPTGTRLRAFLGAPTLVVVAVFVLSETAVQMLLDAVTSAYGRSLVLASVVAVVLAGYARYDRACRTAHAELGVQGAGKLARRKAVVVVLGRKSDRPDSAVARLLAKAGPLTHVALLGTPETDALGIGDTVRTRLLPAAGHVLHPDAVRTFTAPAYDIDAMESVCEDAIRWLERAGMRHRDIVVDITGGTTPMSLGAFVAAERLQVDAQYVATDWDADLEAPDEGAWSFVLVRDHSSPGRA